MSLLKKIIPKIIVDKLLVDRLEKLFLKYSRNYIKDDKEKVSYNNIKEQFIEEIRDKKYFKLKHILENNEKLLFGEKEDNGGYMLSLVVAEYINKILGNHSTLKEEFINKIKARKSHKREQVLNCFEELIIKRGGQSSSPKLFAYVQAARKILEEDKYLKFLK